MNDRFGWNASLMFRTIRPVFCVPLKILMVFLFCAVSHSAYSGDWITNYYQQPTPENFVSEVRGWSASGLLSGNKSYALAVFLGRVMAKNLREIDSWLNQLDDLNGEDRETLLLAAALSNTQEAKSYLELRPNGARHTGRLMDVRKIDANNPLVLDALWFDFFATGEAVPIRRIVTALNYEKYAPAVKPDFEGKRSKNDVTLGMTFLAARWSLTSNAKQHRRVGEILEKLFLSGDLTQPETMWVSSILAQALPDKFELKIRSDEATLIKKAP